MADNTTLYSYSSDADNLDSALITGAESNAATAEDVVDNALIRSKINGEELVGTMPVNASVDVTLTPYASVERTYNIAKGYHPGTGIIRVPALSTLTSVGSAAIEYHLQSGRYVSNEVQINKSCWINGLQVWGLFDGSTGRSGTATADDIRLNKTAWVNGVLITGAMEDGDPTSDINLYCGGSYTIPAGHHGGNRKVNAYSLAVQTPVTNFTYTAVPVGTGVEYRSTELMEGKDVWANGLHVFGTLNMDSYIETYLGITNALPTQVAAGQFFYSKSAGGRACGTMRIDHDPSDPTTHDYLLAGEDYTIIAGYYDGTHIVTAKPLDVQTVGSITSDDVRANKDGWANGVHIVGALVTRTPIETTGTKTLLAGEQYEIQKGIYSGSDVVFAAPLDAQTRATSTATEILNGFTAWVNGVLITGNMPNIGHSQGGATIAVGQSITISKGYHDGTEVITAVAAV